MSNQSVFERIVEHFGSKRKLAEALQVKPQSVQKWDRQIPAERVLQIERLTDGEVTRFEMRPDIFGPEPDAAA